MRDFAVVRRRTVLDLREIGIGKCFSQHLHVVSVKSLGAGFPDRNAGYIDSERGSQIFLTDTGCFAGIANGGGNPGTTDIPVFTAILPDQLIEITRGER